MATAPFNINEAIPGDNDNVSAHPTGARSFRDQVESALAVEHDMKTAGSTARHRFGVGNDAARDAITEWVVGSIWFNTGTTPATLQRVVSVGPVVWEDVNASNALLLAAANTWTGLNTFKITAGQLALIVQSDVNDASSGPIIRVYRNKTGAANDFIGDYSFMGKSSTGVDRVYADVFAQIVTATNGSEDGRWYLRTLRGGAASDWYVDRGCLRHSSVAQPAEAGGVGATQYYKNGVRADGFEGQLLHAAHTATAGTDGGGQTSGSYATRTLNTAFTNEISGVSVSGNQIVDLPAGTYWIEAEAQFYSCNRCKIKLRNVTDSTDTAIGTTGQAGASTGGVSTLARRFTIAATKTFEIQARVSTTNSTTGWGLAANFGDAEIYMDVKLWKIA